MASHRLIIEPPPSRTGRSLSQVTVHVDEAVDMGALATTLAERFGYPLVDGFGSPIAYRLRAIPSRPMLPLTGQFAEEHALVGGRFVLEIEATHCATVAPSRMTRRTLMKIGCTLGGVSVLGFAAGMITGWAQRLSHVPMHTAASMGQVPPVVATSLTKRAVFPLHRGTVRSVVWSPDGTMLASGGADACVLLWRVDGTLVHTLQMLTQVLAVAWSPDGAQLIIGAGNTVTFVEAQQATVLGSYTRHTAPVTALGWTHAAVPLALSASEDKRALVWQGQTHQVQASFARHTTPILALATLTDIVATASLGGVVRIWSAITGQEVHGYWSDTAQAYQSLVFSPGGLLAVGGKDGMIRLWAQGSTCRLQQRDIFGLRCLDLPQRWQGHTGPIRAAAFSSDGDLLATGGDDHQLLLWSKMHQMPLLRHTMSEPITALSWSPTAPYLAVAARSQVTIYQISTEEEG